MGDEKDDDTPPFPEDAPTPRAAAPVRTPAPAPAGPSLDSQLDCCAAPRLLVLKQLYSKEHDSESMDQCAKCGAYWFHRWHEHDSTTWYSPINADEAAALQIARGNVSYLATRRSIMFDVNGKTIVDGAPTDPWT